MSRNLMNLYALFLRRKRTSSTQTVHVTNCDLTTRLSSETLNTTNHDTHVSVHDAAPSAGTTSSERLPNKDDRFQAVLETRSSRSSSLESVIRRRRSDDSDKSDEAQLRSNSSNRATSVIDLGSGNIVGGICQSSEKLQLIDRIQTVSASSGSFNDLSTRKSDSHSSGSEDDRGRRKRGKRWPSEPWLGPTLAGAFAAASVASLVQTGRDELNRLDQVEKELWKRPLRDDGDYNDNVCFRMLTFRIVVFY